MPEGAKVVGVDAKVEQAKDTTEEHQQSAAEQAQELKAEGANFVEVVAAAWQAKDAMDEHQENAAEEAQESKAQGTNIVEKNQAERSRGTAGVQDRGSEHRGGLGGQAHEKGHGECDERTVRLGGVLRGSR